MRSKLSFIMAHLALRSTMEATEPALPKSEYQREEGGERERERERESSVKVSFFSSKCRLAGYDMVITTYNIVGIEGESCEPQPVIK